MCRLNQRPIALLEFVSGFGCVTRHLKHVLPTSTIAAWDIHPEAIRFLRERLETDAIQSNAVPEWLNVRRKFDVVFALSFFSHMPKTTFARCLQQLATAVASGGFLIFTTHGRVTRDVILKDVQLDPEGFFFNPAREQKDFDSAEHGNIRSRC